MGFSIEDAEVFKQALKQGINLFTGAGFSILPNSKGEKLPLGNEYAEELKKKFNLSLPGCELDEVANILNGDILQEYTRNRFKVSDINEKYYAINKINLKSFITTNYDNIPLLINEKNRRYVLCDIRNGPQIGEGMVSYAPLHGNVESDDPIVIGSLSVAGLNTYTSASLKESERLVSSAPTLIWGYGLRDQSSLQVIKPTYDSQKQTIWIQCLENDPRIEYYRQLHLKIIISDTESLLDWLNDNLDDEDFKEDLSLEKSDICNHCVPENTSMVKTAESSEYYNYGITKWFHILSGLAYERAVVSEIHNEALRISHVLIVGSEFSGKTTILMQLALKINSPNKFFFSNITTEMAKHIASEIQGYKTWIFLDDCASLEQFDILASVPNTIVIATTDEYHYESEKNRIKTPDISTINITEITDQIEAQKIREKIPKKFRTKEFTYKKEKDEKYSMIELVTGNVESALSKTMVRKILDRIKKHDEESFELIALAVYLSKRYSAINTDVLMAYFSLTKYEEIELKIHKVNSLLRELDKDAIQIEEDELDQDFFVMRSSLFLYQCVKLFETNGGVPAYRKKYSEMIRRFVGYVSPIHIWNYEVFKKKQYDSELFFIVFGEDADDVYDELYKYSSNIFVIQQRALYHRRCKKYKEAFEEISKVYSALPNNPSVKNSYAIILFEMYQQEHSEESLEKMKKAMKMFEELHENDERKRYHTEKYAEYAIYLAKKMGVKDYVDNAIKWIDSLELPSNDKLHNYRKELMQYK